MSNTRQISDVYALSIAAASSAIAAYCHYVFINHRSIWDRQHIYLLLLFALFPEVYVCQLVVDSILVIQRYFLMHERYIPMPNEGPWYYIGSILDLHTKDRSLGPEPQGNCRISTLAPSHLGGVLARLTLLAVAASVSVLIWLHAIFELVNVKNSHVEPWTVAWEAASPGVHSFYGFILGIWSA